MRITRADVLAAQWAISEPVDALRQWATDSPVYGLDRASKKVVIGGIDVDPAPAASGKGRRSSNKAGVVDRIMIPDPTGLVSGEHAYLQRTHDHWCIHDLKSTNGLFLDRVRKTQDVLTPGLEIQLGGAVTLVAESPRLRILRHALQRMLGWNQLEVVDHALQSIRLAAQRRAVLVLCGQRDLVPLATELHQLTLGTRPFALCGSMPRSKTDDTPLHPAASALEALAAAPAGTVCTSGQDVRDLGEMLVALRSPSCRTQLVVCSEDPEALDFLHNRQVSVRSIVVPALANRGSDELERVIDDYATLAGERLRMPRFKLTATERLWIRTRASRTLFEIQLATLRVAALHLGKDQRAAAAALNMTHPPLIRWLTRRGFFEVVGDVPIG